ncbi:MAG: transposase [Patescibacteria group bacterium]
MQKPIFVNGHIYHSYNRGVEKRDVFMDKQDYLRFIHCLFEFNDTKTAKNMFYYFNTQDSEVQPHYLKKNRKPRKLLVEILAFTLMPNHFHLLLKQKKEDGIAKFMQKLGTGYTMYFNQKYERVGSLFQGRFKAVHVEEHSHFLHIPHYIHSNPLGLPDCRGSTSLVGKIKFLESYRWSSFSDYVGKKNFPSVTQKDFLLNFFGKENKYKKEAVAWLKNYSNNLEEIKNIVLE